MGAAVHDVHESYLPMDPTYSRTLRTNCLQKRLKVILAIIRLQRKSTSIKISDPLSLGSFGRSALQVKPQSSSWVPKNIRVRSFKNLGIGVQICFRSLREVVPHSEPMRPPSKQRAGRFGRP